MPCTTGGAPLLNYWYWQWWESSFSRNSEQTKVWDCETRSTSPYSLDQQRKWSNCLYKMPCYLLIGLLSKNRCSVTWDQWMHVIFFLVIYRNLIGKQYLKVIRTLTLSHGSKSRSRPPTRPAPRRISLGDSDRTRTIRAKRYIERQKNYEKIMTNHKKM